MLTLLLQYFTILQYFSVPFVHFCICFFVQPSEYWVSSNTVSQIQSDCGSSDTFPHRDCSQITPLFQPHFVLNPFMGNFLDPQSFRTDYNPLTLITPYHYRLCSGPRSSHVRRQGRIVTFAFLLYYVQSYPWK